MDPYEFIGSDADSDDDLQRAIQLSLQEQSPPRSRPSGSRTEASSSSSSTRPGPGPSSSPRKPATPRKRKIEQIDLTGDDDDEPEEDKSAKMRRMLKEVPGSAKKAAQSMGGAGSGQHAWRLPAVRKDEKKKEDAVKETGAGFKGPVGLNGIDRKQMELERLERIRKMEAKKEGKKPVASGVSPAEFYNASVHTIHDADSKRTKPEAATAAAATSPKRSMGSTGSAPTASSSSGKSNMVSRFRPADRTRYPKGTIKKTAAEGFPKTGDDITIEEVLQADTLTTTVLSAFQWDERWIMEKLPLHKKDFRMLLVRHAKEPADRESIEQTYLGLPRISLCFPNMDGQINCMHSKLMLLFHKEGDEEWLRIAIPTANLTDYDWGQDGIMENMVFLIDLPRLADPMPDQTFFLEELLYFCQMQDFPEEYLTLLVHYDFSATEPLAFVHSIGGSHGAQDWKRTGYPGLGTAIKRLGYHSGPGLEVDYVTSSLGAANEQFISNIYRAAMGQNGERELNRRIGKKPPTASRGKGSKRTLADEDVADGGEEMVFEEETDWPRIVERFRVFFPSRDTVVNSRGGRAAGGTICFQPQWWNRAEFPKSIVMDTQSVRPGMLMHTKLLLARPSTQLTTPDGTFDAWAYVGSANLSESAWGKLVRGPKLNVKNWECGVVVPVPARDAGRALAGKKPARLEPLGVDVFQGTVPLPMQVPGTPMGRRTPWFFRQELMGMR